MKWDGFHQDKESGDLKETARNLNEMFLFHPRNISKLSYSFETLLGLR